MPIKCLNEFSCVLHKALHVNDTVTISLLFFVQFLINLFICKFFVYFPCREIKRNHKLFILIKFLG